MTALLAIQHVSTWNLGWQFVALMLPPYLLACYFHGRRHRWKFIAIVLVLLGIGICTTITDFHNRQVTWSMAWGQGYKFDPVPWVYISAEDLQRGLVADMIVFAFSAILTGIAWVGYPVIRRLITPEPNELAKPSPPLNSEGCNDQEQKDDRSRVERLH